MIKVFCRWCLLLSLLIPAYVAASTGTLLVVNKSGNSVSMLDLASGQQIATLPTGEGPHEIAVAPDGNTAVVSIYGTDEQPGNRLDLVDVWRARISNSIDLGQYRRPHGLAWLPDNRRILVTVEENRALLVVDIERGIVEAAIDTGAALSHMVVTDSAGRHAYVANIGSGSISVIDLQQERLLATASAGKGTEGIALSPDGQHLWVTNRESETVMVFETKSMRRLATLPAKDFPLRVVLSPDGSEALVSQAKGSRIEFFDTESKRSSGILEMPAEFSLTNGRWLGGAFGNFTLPIGILYHPDGKTAYVANAYGGFIAVVDIAGRKVTATLEAGAEPDGLAYSPLTPR